MSGSTRKALITGVTGQDGALLSQILLSKGYEVFGTSRSDPTAASCWRLHELGITDRVRMIRCGLDTVGTIESLLKKIEPDEIYNFAGRSFVPAAVDDPLGAADDNAILPLRLLEAMRRVRPRARIVQASSADMFGTNSPGPQSETTPFRPGGPYGYAKVFAHGMVDTFRSAHGLFCCSAILFNHESPLRGEEFVTRKIAQSVARIVSGRQDCLVLGNLDARRDWGSAAEYVEGMWRMLQQSQPADYVLATGRSHTVREFTERAFSTVGIRIEWRGAAESESGIDASTQRVVVKVSPELFRPTDGGLLCGDAARARRVLGWTPTTSFDELVDLMVRSDLNREGAKT